MTIEKIHRASDKRLRDQITAWFKDLQAQITALGSALISDTAYDATTWNGVTTIAPSKNAVRDQIEVIKADYVPDTGNTTIDGIKTFTSDPLIPDEAYGVGWNGVLEPPTKNAVYDKIQLVAADIDALEAADVIHDDRLGDLEGYRPGGMLYDGTTGFYSGTYTSSGSAITVVVQFRCGTISGTGSRSICHFHGPTVDETRMRVLVWSAGEDSEIAGHVGISVDNSANTEICLLISPSVVTDDDWHTLFASFNGATGATTFYVDGVNADDTGNSFRVTPVAGTLDSGASSNAHVGAQTSVPDGLFPGYIGYVGMRDAYLTNWSDFMDGSVPKNIQATLSTVWGGTPAYWAPNGQMHRNEGSAADMVINGSVTLYVQGVETAWTIPDEELDDRLTDIEPLSGTFTPTIQDASFSDAESQTYTVQLGYYRKTADVVTFWIDVAINSLGTLTTTDQAFIAGLPFTSNANVSSPCAVGLGNSLAITAGNAVAAYVTTSNTIIALVKWSATGGTSNLTVAELSAGGRLRVAGSYITS